MPNIFASRPQEFRIPLPAPIGLTRLKKVTEWQLSIVKYTNKPGETERE